MQLDKFFKVYNSLINKYLSRPFLIKVPFGPIKGLKIYISPKHGVKKLVGTYEPKIANVIYKEVEKGYTCLDIGSHVGYMTLVMRKKAGPTGRIDAFDPIEEGCKMLAKSVDANKYENVHIYNYALGDENTSKQAHIFSDSAIANFLDSGFVTYDKVEAESFNMITLDEHARLNPYNSINFIKIDVEGYEYNVLKGGGHVIEKYKPKLLIEIHNKSVYKKVVKYLSNRAYKITDLDKKEIPEDFIMPEHPFHILAFYN